MSLAAGRNSEASVDSVESTEEGEHIKFEDTGSILKAGEMPVSLKVGQVDSQEEANLDGEALLWSEELKVCEDKSADDKLGAFNLKASSSPISASLQSRDGAAYLDFLGQHFDASTMPLSPYGGLDAIEIGPEGPKVYRPPLRKEQALRPLEAEGGKWWTMSSNATSDLEKIVGKGSLEDLDDPYYVMSSSEETKDVGMTLRRARSGQQFFETCAKVWDRISRADMEKEWQLYFNADGIADFNFERSVCEYNNENVGIQYPTEWQNEEILPLRDNDIMATSELQEPITITREAQLRKLKRVAKRVCKHLDGADSAAVYAHMALFTHSMSAAQDALDECCKQPEGTKSRNSANQDYLVCLELEEVFACPSGGLTEQMRDVYSQAKEAAQGAAQGAGALGLAGDEEKQAEHDWASLRVPREVMERRGVQASFIEAHNRNVDAMCSLLASRSKSAFTAYPNCLPNYGHRLLSDTLIQAAISLRKALELELSAMRRDLYTEEDVGTVRELLIARGGRNGWRGIGELQSELDQYNLDHLQKINDKIAKRVAKANAKQEYAPSDEALKAWEARAARKLRLCNENGVPHNLKYGKWHYGKVHSFKGNITGSPVAGSPVAPPKNAVSSEAALQYAFLTSHDTGYALHNRSTISHTYEGCSAVVDLVKGVVSLSVSRGEGTIEKRLLLPRALKDANKAASVAFRWTSKSNEYLEEAGAI